MSAERIKVNIQSLKKEAEQIKVIKDYLKKHGEIIDISVKLVDEAQSTTTKKLSHTLENTKDNYENGLIELLENQIRCLNNVADELEKTDKDLAKNNK